MVLELVVGLGSEKLVKYGTGGSSSPMIARNPSAKLTDAPRHYDGALVPVMPGI